MNEQIVRCFLCDGEHETSKCPNRPTKLPEDVEQHLVEIEYTHGLPYHAQALRAYIAHQRAVMEAMAEEIAYHAGCTDCPRTSCAYETKCRSMECTANILAHFRAQVKGGSK